MVEKRGWAGRLKGLFSRMSFDESFFEELKDLLIEGDVGVKTAMTAVETLRERARKETLNDRSKLLEALKRILLDSLRSRLLDPEPGKLNFFLVLGVNGVGKTTTIAKLADFYRRNHRIQRIILAAGDTFRAAAIDQLVCWGERLDLPVIRQAPGADPGAVIYDSISSARARKAELVLADTAGRMHTRDYLVRELGKIDKIVRNRLENGSYRKILILDATTGQNALRQAEVFHRAVGVDSIIMAKYDSSAKGGVVIAISSDLGLPISFLGTGETLRDIVVFDPRAFLDDLVEAP